MARDFQANAVGPARHQRGLICDFHAVVSEFFAANIRLMT